ncbi:MAG: cytochrome c-type biogenesis protein CcmH [Abitibacteriaceae bacterium]|nr:cytochrome c-type biogenesis protein CcmH [Abditibacteriaceae bacterium]
MRHLWLVLCCLCCSLCCIGVPASNAASEPTVSDIGRELICSCPDCGKQSVEQCPAGCAYGKKYRAEIAGQIQQGKSKDQILNYFADKYGEQILGNPRPHGVGLVAPLVPWFGALIGLLIVGVMMRSGQRAKRSRRSGTATVTSSANTPTGPEDPRLSAALRDFDY